jgi:hypothetical protein
MPAASAAPDPPLEPPGMWSRFHGLRVVGVMTPNANSCVCVFPTMTAPASRSRSTTAPSLVGTLPAIVRELDVVSTPAVSTRSFTPTETPCSGPRYRPAAISSAAVAAAARARSAVTVTYAPTRPSTASIRSSTESTSSTGDSCLLRIASPAWSAFIA